MVRIFVWPLPEEVLRVLVYFAAMYYFIIVYKTGCAAYPILEFRVLEVLVVILFLRI